MKRFIDKIRNFLKFFKVDYSFILLLFLAFFLGNLKFYFWYIIFIFLHEMSHLFVAWKFGYFPSRIRLSIFGASLEGFDDFLAPDEIKIILAGPMLNLIVVILCYLSFWFYPESFEYLGDILLVNKSILFFNLLPIFPLDFGRILLCFFSIKNGRKSALKLVKNLSFGFIVIMFIVSIIIFFVSFDLTLGFACLNLCIISFEASQGTSFKREIILRKKIKRLNKGIEQKVICVDSLFDERLLLKFIDGEHYFVFVFVDKNFNQTRKIDEFQLLKNLGFIE